jgi:WD40 repeat protein
MFGHQNIVTGLAINRAGDTIATGSPDQTLRLWRPFDNLL